MYRVGDVILFNEHKTHAYIIEADNDQLRVVTEQGVIRNLTPKDIDKKLVLDKKASVKDSMGNSL